ncbi:uncharacterized protein LOC128921331 [Zeugodacus cucurbitae]|uniref:uncharacterized protein LOC128921331 n=1 Tax=Zeugodacus cucurbitae TaxID=28588 RepID=UPI0023D8F063|nr:uncharacterized protein LOC128921331 [Zeugodacus cucurbitae]
MAAIHMKRKFESGTMFDWVLQRILKKYNCRKWSRKAKRAATHIWCGHTKLKRGTEQGLCHFRQIDIYKLRRKLKLDITHILPYGKVAILGMGAGNPTSSSSRHTTAIAHQSYNTNSN